MRLPKSKPDISKLPGGHEPSPQIVPTLLGNQTVTPSVRELYMWSLGSAYVVENLLSPADCEKLKDFYAECEHIASAPVSVAGFQDGDENAAYGGVAGSTRTTMWSLKLAEQVWGLLAPYVDVKHAGKYTSTDWFQDGEHRDWLPVGVTPMMRFMRYEEGGEHYGHYDAGYIYDDGEHRSLMSMVIYLTDNHGSGATRFLWDEQYEKPVHEREFSDWDVQAKDSQVVHRVEPRAGSVLLFDHRLCHDVEEYTGEGPRMIIRGDVAYRKLKFTSETMQS